MKKLAITTWLLAPFWLASLGSAQERLSIPVDPAPNAAASTPAAHRKVLSGTLHIENGQTRTFKLDCDSCPAGAEDAIYKAPTAMNLRALDGKRVRVDFNAQGKVQSVRRIDARRRVSSTPAPSVSPDTTVAIEKPIPRNLD